MHQQNLQLEQEAQALAQRLDAVMQDKFKRINSGFDADTPIDKTLNFLQAFIAVSFLASLMSFALTPLSLAYRNSDNACASCIPVYTGST